MDEEGESEYEFEEDSDSSEDDEICYDQQPSLLEEDWQYPYLKDMKCGHLKNKKLAKGKYDAVFGPYRYGITPERNLASRGAKRKVPDIDVDKKKPEGCTPGRYRSYTSEHSTCTTCATTVENKISKIKVTIGKENISSRISIPDSARYEVVRQALQKKPTINTETDLKSWIFTPTYNRVLKGYFNLTHNMVDCSMGGEISKSYVHLLVVRAGEFEKYCKMWSASHVILELPVEVPGVVS